jgi:hypothetical protein
MNDVVKVEESGSKLSKKLVEDTLWRRGVLYWKMHKVQRDMYDIYHKADPRSTLVWLCSRQLGKTIISSTYVSTPTGIKKIKDIVPGDIVYGYNKDGTVSPTRVIWSESKGIKKFNILSHRTRVMAVCTDEHRWAAYDSYKKDYDLNCRTDKLLANGRMKIARRYFEPTGGIIHEPHAYTLGAMIGDGCCTSNSTNSYWISSENKDIPLKCANEIGLYLHKNGGNNYNWVLNSRETLDGKVAVRKTINHYDDWCHNKLAHEKTCDYDVIKTWSRESQLRFLAGLIDTDGCIFITGREKHELKFSLSMQAEHVINVVKEMFLHLWQIDLCYSLDNRKKYKNGPCHTVYTNNNFCVKRFLSELSQYLVCDRKKYKPEYDAFPEYNHIPDYCGVVKSGEVEGEGWDIQVDNETNLFCLANGLVSHNSYMITMMCLEACMQTPNTNVALITDTKLHLEGIFEPLFRDILLEAPEDIRPEYNKSKFTFYFKNGSQIHLAGSDGGHAEKLRGKKYSAIFIDEAGFCSNLTYIVNSILIPTLTHTNGKIVMSTTPPENPDHEFIPFMEKAEVLGKLTKKTIYDNPLISIDVIESIKAELGEDSDGFKREYLCRIIKSTDRCVIPEFTEEIEKELVVETPRPMRYMPYVGMDLGYKDLTAVVFGYYNFDIDKLVIEDEIVIDGKKLILPEFVKNIMNKERDLFTNPYTNEFNKPVRVSDINYLVTQEMHRLSDYQLFFEPPKKDDLGTMINQFRTLIKNKKILINPRCKHTISHIKNAQWKNANVKIEFGRSEVYGHYDALAAAYYMARRVEWSKNPYPSDFPGITDKTFIYTDKDQNTSNAAEVFKKVFFKRRN